MTPARFTGTDRIRRRELRVAVVAFVIVAATACASSGIVPGTTRELGLVGTYRFDVVLDESIRGTVTFTEEDRYTVQCIDDTTRPNPPIPLGFGAGRVEWLGCGARFQTWRNDAGDVVSQAYRTVREQVSSERVCNNWEQLPEGGRQCIGWEDRPIWRERTAQAQLTMEPVAGGMR